MKLLLLTDIPPCSNLTAGLVLGQLCRFMAPGSLACFTVLNRHLTPELFPDLAWIPTKVMIKPNEYPVRRPQNSRLGSLSALAIETYKRRFLTPKLVEKASIFAEEQGVDAVWAVLQGQTIVRMALPLAKRLRKPLFTQVWDPLSWWLKAHQMDRWNRRLALRQFDATLRASKSCAAASWAMAEHYQQTYGVPSVPVIASHDRSIASKPRPSLRQNGEVVIGMAGQFYANDEWVQLTRALAHAGWQLAGRKVRLKVLGHQLPLGEIPASNLDFVGWKSQVEAVRILSEETDVLYCPYPFIKDMEEVARLSFPSKVPIYLAAGRPILFHGPLYASPRHYFTENGAAVICDDLYPASLYNALQRLVEDAKLFKDTALRGQMAFERDFTLERMREEFKRFLGNSQLA